MLPIHVEYALGVGNYRAATYFGTAIRHRRALQILALVVIVAAFYTVGATLGAWPLIMLPAYLALAYLIWLVVLLGRTELAILRFVKADRALLGRTMSLTFTEEQLTLALPGRGGFSRPLKELFAAFETSQIFTIYLDAQQTVLLPISALTPEQRATLRGLLGRKLKERFDTRYGPKGEKKRRGLFGR